MNRIRKDNKGVSPVIATILMVAITVVLAGVLVVYLQTLPSSGGDVETNLGVRADKASGGGWILNIITGSKNSVDVQIQVVNPATGGNRIVPTYLAVAPGPVDVNNANFVFNDNNNNDKVDAGDTITISAYSAGPPITGAMAGDKVQFLKGSSIIGTIKELPS
jgi:flagellin-like protein